MPTFDLDSVDWDQIYSDGPHSVPWNIGTPQPVLQELIDQGFVSSPVLDAGCGVGVTAIYLAAAGYTAVGVDLSQAAIDEARQGTDSKGLHITFTVGDLTDIRNYDGYFSTVLDSAVFHSMPVNLREKYVLSLAKATKTGARFFALVFSMDAFTQNSSYGPRVFTSETLREAVEPYFVVDSIKNVKIHLIPPPSLPEGFEFRNVTIGSTGLVQLPALLLSSHRS